MFEELYGFGSKKKPAKPRSRPIRKPTQKTVRGLSVTQAIKVASNSISLPVGSGSTWELYGPRCTKLSKLDGQSVTAYASNYRQAQAKRKQWIAYIALVLLGYDNQDADNHACSCDAGMSVRDVVATSIKKCRVAEVQKPWALPSVVVLDRPAGNVIS
jgi:hypothetical protein